MRVSVQEFFENEMRNRRNQMIVFFVVTVLAIFSALVTFWLLRTSAVTLETTACPHERAHWNGAHENCSYRPEMPCGHAHGEACFSVLALPEAPCAHVCAEDDDCGYSAAVACDFVCLNPTCHTDSNGGAAINPALLALFGEGVGVDQGLVAILNCEESYLSGSPVQFRLFSSYSHAGSGGTVEGEKVDVQIKLDGAGYTLHTAGIVTDGEYAGWEYIRIAASGGDDSERYLYYNSAEGIIEYTIGSGDSFVGYLDLSFPNGTTKNGTEIALTPARKDGSTAENDTLTPADATIVSGFDWSDVEKTANVAETGLGAPYNLVLAGAKDITYTITASKEYIEGASDKNGNIFTAEYTIADTISLENFYFDFSGTDDGQITRAYAGGTLQFQVKKSNKYITFLTINVPEADAGNVTLVPVYDAAPDAAHITGFQLTYTKKNGNPVVQDLPNVNLQISLKCLTAREFFFLNPKAAPSGTAGESQYVIKNNVVFEAESVFYNEAYPDDEDNFHHSEDDVAVRGTAPGHSLSKVTESKLTDSGEVRNPTSLAGSGTRSNNSAEVTAGESFYYRIRFVNNMQFYDELYLSDALPYVVSGDQVLDPDSFKIVCVNVHFDNGMVGYEGVEYKGTAGNAVNWDDRISTAGTVKAFKKFTNVPVGAVIVIVCEVTVSSDISAIRKPRNTAYVSTGYDVENFNPINQLVESHIDKTITPSAAKIQVQKVFLNTDGKTEGTNYYFNENDPVKYQVTINNSATIDVTTTFYDTWPGDGVKLTEISGVPAGLAIELYDSEESGTLIDTIVSNGAANPVGDYAVPILLIRIPNLVIPAKGSVTIVTDGVVTGDGEYTNTAKVGGGPGTSLSFSTKHLSLSTEKAPYLIEPNTGGMNWNDGNQTYSGYYDGSVVRYEISVRNNSLTGDILRNIRVIDQYDTIYETTGSYPREGTYGGVTGTVIVEYPDGTFAKLEETSLEAVYSVASSGYHKVVASDNYTSTNYIGISLINANLKALETIKFHIFFQITDRILDALSQNNILYLGNYIATTAWDGAVTPDSGISAEHWMAIWPIDKALDRSAEVVKSTVAVYSSETGALKDARTTTQSAAKDDYLIYSVRIDNTSVSSAEGMAVYKLIDTLPEGTTFVGLIAPNLVSDGWMSRINRLEDENPTVGAACYEGNQVWNLNFHATIQYDATSRRLEVTFTQNHPNPDLYAKPILTPGIGAAFGIVARVTEARDTYDNIAGYIVEEDIDTTTRSERAGDGQQYIYDNASFSGPVYHAGIEKTAAQYHYGGIWYPLGSSDYIVIQPSYQIRWHLTLTNGALSTTALKNYRVVDILPKEFCYVAGTSTLGGAPMGEPAVRTLDDGRKELTWNIPGPLAAGHSTVLTFVSEWDELNNPAQTRGLYQNQASIVLEDYNLQGSTYGELDKVKRTVTDYAQVNMLGDSGTTSYKSLENITSSSPFYGEVAEGIRTTEHITAIAGDTVRYTLHVTNRSMSALKSFVLIDSLPRVGDTGVVNRSIQRNSKFSVDFAGYPNVTVRVIRADKSEEIVSADQYTADYRAVGAGELSVDDWAGAAGTWGAREAESDSIRIVLDDSLNITLNDTVIVTFDAVVAGEIGANVSLPTSEDYAWNSFGYAYKTETSTTLYAEPIKVGVKIPYATIHVAKTVVDEKSGHEITDETPFSFVLSRKTADGGWEPAEGVRYEIDGTVYLIGADGRFSVRGGQSITLYAPALSFYRLEEVDIPEGYALQRINGDSGLAAFETGELAEGANASAVFVNERRQDKWTVRLLKKSCYDEVMTGVTFTLQKKGEDGVFTTFGGYENVATDIDGVILFENLPAGVYRLIEEATKDGYNLVGDTIFTLPYSPAGTEDILPDEVTIVPTAEGGADFLVTVINYSTLILPETGGKGVLPLQRTGALLMSAAALTGTITLFPKKRRSSRNGK